MCIYLEWVGTIDTLQKENELYLDKLQVEKERGITVKAHTASLFYNQQNTHYLLNLIDTPVRSYPLLQNQYTKKIRKIRK